MKDETMEQTRETKDAKIRVRITEEQRQQLNELVARNKDLSLSYFIRIFIDEGLARHFNGQGCN